MRIDTLENTQDTEADQKQPLLRRAVLAWSLLAVALFVALSLVGI